MPPLITYQVDDHPPTSERGLVEREARASSARGDRAALERPVVERRYNVVRSNVPHVVRTLRRLGDYLGSGDGLHRDRCTS